MNGRGHVKDLTGQRFGMLTADEIAAMILEAKDADGDSFGWQHAPAIAEEIGKILAGKVCRCEQDRSER